MVHFSRRSFVAGMAACCASAASTPRAVAQQGESLGAAAARAGLLYGAAIDGVERLEPACLALFAKHARILTTENALKFGVLRPDPERFDFAEADRIAALARANGQKLRGHTLIWNDNAPDWLKRRPGREIERIFDAHVDRVAERYAGQIHAWDVVNEPFFPLQGQPGGFRDGPWFAAMGPAYVERAFRRVAAIDRHARLVLNEAFCETNHAWGRAIRPRLSGLVDRLLDAGAPIHAIGFQAHQMPHWPHSDAEFAAYAETFGARGLDIHLTELDVDDESFAAPARERDLQVASRYAEFLKPVLALRAVTMVTTWGLSDRHSWWRDIHRAAGRSEARLPRPLPFDDAFAPKPATTALMAAFRQRPAPDRSR